MNAYEGYWKRKKMAYRGVCPLGIASQVHLDLFKHTRAILQQFFLKLNHNLLTCKREAWEDFFLRLLIDST